MEESQTEEDGGKAERKYRIKEVEELLGECGIESDVCYVVGDDGKVFTTDEGDDEGKRDLTP